MYQFFGTEEIGSEKNKRRLWKLHTIRLETIDYLISASFDSLNEILSCDLDVIMKQDMMI